MNRLDPEMLDWLEAGRRLRLTESCITWTDSLADAEPLTPAKAEANGRGRQIFAGRVRQRLVRRRKVRVEVRVNEGVKES